MNKRMSDLAKQGQRLRREGIVEYDYSKCGQHNAVQSKQKHMQEIGRKGGLSKRKKEVNHEG